MNIKPTSENKQLSQTACNLGSTLAERQLEWCFAGGPKVTCLNAPNEITPQKLNLKEYTLYIYS